MAGTHLASSARVLWRILERRGCDPAAVFREQGLDPGLLTDPRARYPSTRIAAAWERADALLADPCFGLEAADAWRPSDYHAVGYAMLASRTVRRAIERMVRYFRIINDLAGFEITATPPRLTVTFVPPAGRRTAPAPRGRLPVSRGRERRRGWRPGASRVQLA